MPSPDQCERIFHAALKAADWKGVEAALLCLAVQDPHRAEQLVAAGQAALLVVDAVLRSDQAAAATGRRGGLTDE